MSLATRPNAQGLTDAPFVESWNLDRETVSGLPAHPPKRLLAPSPINLGAIREFGGCTRQSGLQLHNGNDPPPAPGSLKALLFPPLLNKATNKGNARGASEVRRATSSIHFHCPVPRSSSHIGHGFFSRRRKTLRIFSGCFSPEKVILFFRVFEITSENAL